MCERYGESEYEGSLTASLSGEKAWGGKIKFLEGVCQEGEKTAPSAD